MDELYQALCLGLRDYVAKNGFEEVVLGLSGGIDSSLAATVAADALDPSRVHGIVMPSRYTSEESRADAKQLASNLGIDHRVVDVDDLFEAHLEALGDRVDVSEGTLARENLQPRIRGVALMAYSNAEGWLVLSAGNKSEISLGYATLYGDTTGGFAPLGDVLKTTVYELARWRNDAPDGSAIPERILQKPPSAELRPDQTDQDDLPPYDEVDPILAAYVEEGCSVDEILERGHDEATVREVVRRVDGSEYKRRQSPPVLRVSARAFGRDWRFPITNGWGRGD
jgi:NAD+ synthase (glutamine-hydrolysing)